MVSILIDDLDETLHERIASSAAAHHRSIEVEARELLRVAMARQACSPLDNRTRGPRENIVDAARRLFGPEHGVDLDIPARGNQIEGPPPDFSDGY